MYRQIANRRAAQEGQATAEFALILPVLFLLTLVAIQLATIFLQYQQVSAAASEGARRAVVSRNAVSPSQTARDAAIAAAPSLALNNGNVTVNSTWTPGSNVTVTVTKPYTLPMAVPGLPQVVNLTNARTMRVEQ